MEQPIVIKKDIKNVKKFEQWCFKQTVEIEHKKQKLQDERQNLSKERIRLAEEADQLERERRTLLRKQELESIRMKQEQHLFDMKWKILEEELKKLASEKQQVQRQREFFHRATDYQKGPSRTTSNTSNVVKGELFFVGVNNEASLKKRYKDLIKIYHPDNLAGDTGTIQEINREYDKLRKKLG